MKRFNRFVSLDQAVDRLAEDKNEAAVKAGLAKSLPLKLFGPTIAAHIDEIEIKGETLRIRVSDPVWRKELIKNKTLLMQKTRARFPKIGSLVVVA